MQTQAAIIRSFLNARRLGNGVAADVEEALNELFDELAAQLTKIDPAAPTSEVWRRRRVQKILADVEKRADDAFEAIYKKVRQQVAEIGAAQTRQTLFMLDSMLKRALDVTVGKGEVGINLAKSIIDTNPLQGELMKDAFSEMSNNVLKRVRREIQQGMAQSETTDDLVRRIRGRATGTRGVYSGGVLDTTTREAEALVRTAVNDISNQAALSTYQANSDIVSYVQFVATLDSRTTYICMAHDGEVYRIDDPDLPTPPLHWGCRSILVPVIDWGAVGLTPPDEGQRASADGPVPASTDYQAWLEQQSAAEQDAILGPQRAELFRNGDITLKDLVNGDGHVVRAADL